MLQVISRVLALVVAGLMAAALFVTFVAVWSWWEPLPREPGAEADPVSVHAEPEAPPASSPLR